jgi:hypothetical protein
MTAARRVRLCSKEEHFMSVKSKLFASAAALTMVSGVVVASGMAAGTASAETPSCGQFCIDLFNFGPGSTYQNPSFLLDSYKQGQQTGTPLILFATNNTDPAEDFTAQSPESVSDWLQAGLVSPLVALHYGCLPASNYAQCTPGDVDDWAFEVEYSPFGAPTGECVGVAATAVAGEKVTLQPCGVSGKTLWIWDTPCVQTGSSNGSCNWTTWWTTHRFPLINGSDTNFSQPFVLTYPNGASPVNLPRADLEVENLTVFASSGGYPGSNVNDNQLWGARFGTVAP